MGGVSPEGVIIISQAACWVVSYYCSMKCLPSYLQVLHTTALLVDDNTHHLIQLTLVLGTYSFNFNPVGKGMVYISHAYRVTMATGGHKQQEEVKLKVFPVLCLLWRYLPPSRQITLGTRYHCLFYPGGYLHVSAVDA